MGVEGSGSELQDFGNNEAGLISRLRYDTSYVQRASLVVCQVRETDFENTSESLHNGHHGDRGK